MNITLTGSAGTLTFDENDIVASNGVDIKKTHTGISDFRITLRGERSIEDFAARQDLIKVDVESGTEFIGYLTDVSHSETQGTTTISGVGIGKRLEETRPDYDSLGGSLTYSNISVQEALRDYWARTPFDNVTVYDQPLETVAENELVQSADTNAEWNDILTFAYPELWDVSSNTVSVHQTAFTREGEAADADSGLTNAVDGSYSGGSAARYSVSSHFAEYNFTLDYTLPDGEFEAWVRFDTPDGQSTATSRWTLSDSSGTQVAQSDTRSLASLSLEWSNVETDWGGFSVGELEPDTYTLRFDIIDDSNQAPYALDVVAPADSLTRITGGSDATNAYTFDNDNGGSSGYLDGPELYPASLVAETVNSPVSFNISDSSLTSVWNNTSNDQRISVSNDGGTTYTDFNNTDTLTQSYSGAGRELKTKFRVSRYGSRTSATPQTGYLVQEIDSFEHRVDGNNLAVIVDLELSKNHFENLQTLHDKGDFVWNIEHADATIPNLLVESFRKGTQTKTLPVSKEIDSNPEISGGNYYNSIYLQGALVNGSRPVAEVKDDDRITQDGREISPGVLRDHDITTEGGAVYEANVLLSRATKNNALRGTKTYPADLSIQPGYSYATDFGNGAVEFPLEELALRYTGSEAQVQLDFVPRGGLAEDVSELKRNNRQQGDRI